MSFRAYPEYKPSGFDWLPEVPAHWVDRKIARDIPFVVGWTPPSGKDEYYDGDLPWVTIADMTQMSVEDTKSKISYLAVQDKGAKVVPAGSMLFSFKLSVGKIAFLTIDSYTNEAIAGFLPCGPLDLEYWKYAAPEFIPRYGRENIYGATLLNQELISSVRFSAPARAEQTQIARFLDHETARIDALIEEQQRLIELLKEKRQAVISHAVTKGLDPKVPMKHSGVEWLGEVPAHWVVRKLKNLVSVRGGSTPSKEVERYWEGDIPWVSPKDMKSERISDSIDHVSDSAIKDGGLNMVKGGAILIVVRGMILIHSVPVAITDVDVTINQDMKAMTPCAELSSDYLSLLLQGVRDAVFQYIDSSAHGTRKLEWERFELINLPVPSHSEQNSIVSSIEMQKRAIDDLTEQAASAITLMKERRSALISAAVTGKIDVRGWQPSASAPIPELVQEAV